MSTSRVKRSYDTFCGEEAMATSPQCSPRRITTLDGSMPPMQLAAPSAASSTVPLHRLNFDQPAAAATASSSSSIAAAPFTFQSIAPVTFASLQPIGRAAAASPVASSPSPSPTPSYSTPAPYSKRVRKLGQTDVAMTDSDEASTTDGTLASVNEAGKHESPFPKLKRPALDELMFVPRSYKKQAIAAALTGPNSSASHATPIAAPIMPGVIPPPPSSVPGVQLPSYHHQLFTYDQVASIVRNAVEMREEQIREEYNRTLQQLLREQFDSFSSFNRDYIARNMKAKDAEEDHENSYYS